MEIKQRESFCTDQQVLRSVITYGGVEFAQGPEFVATNHIDGWTLTAGISDVL